jgi:hypothetical protein
MQYVWLARLSLVIVAGLYQATTGARHLIGLSRNRGYYFAPILFLHFSPSHHSPAAIFSAGDSTVTNPYQKHAIIPFR